MNQDELEIWKRLNECECVKGAMGAWWFIGDICIIDPRGTLHTCHYNNSIKDFHATWIPPIYDPIRPERSLWGMSQEIRTRCWPPGDCISFVAFTDRPDLALAKAIIEQEEK